MPGQSPLSRVSRQEVKDLGMHRRTFLTTALAAPLARPALAQSNRARTLRFMPQAQAWLERNEDLDCMGGDHD